MTSGARPAAKEPAPDPAKVVVDLEVVADRTRGSRADEGFLRVRRLRLCRVHADGTKSAPFDCDIVSRSRTDAVAIVLFETREGARGKREVRVALKTGVRPPVFLRRHLALTQPDTRTYGDLAEIVAGMLEPDDVGPEGIATRAAHESLEEAGISISPQDVLPLGAEAFPSPGITDEKVHFRAARASLDDRGVPTGDGSVMEEGGGVWLLPLDEALTACRTGEIPDMKTEIALSRLCDLLGYLPQLGLFVDELPASLREKWKPLGLEKA